jgi:DNA-binding FadR family transcriptional regulator
VLEALLWAFHNAKSGLCYPSYERVAEAAHCARSTVAEALKALEDAGVLTWVHRVKRVREPCPDLLGDDGWHWRVLRTSNAYNFRDPSPSADRQNSLLLAAREACLNSTPP